MRTLRGFLANLRRRLLHGLVNSLLQFYDSFCDVFDFMQLMRHRDFQRGLIEARVNPDPAGTR